MTGPLVVKEHPYWALINGGYPYRPLPWQDFHIHARQNIRRLILACGRRSGKSFALKAEAVREAARGPEEVMGIMQPPLIYVCGPNYELSMRVWDPIWRLYVPDDGPLHFLYKDHDKQRRLIELLDGTTLQGKSADDPKSLQGDRVTCAIVDEAQDFNEEAWSYLMPALADSGGRLIAAGIARGRGRFRSYFRRGVDEETGFYSASVSSLANPQMTPEVLTEMTADLTEVEFKQQYLAEWVDQDGLVFGEFEDLFKGIGRRFEDRPAAPYIMGLDVGKLHDYTVAYVLDVGTLEFVAMDRFNGLDYTVVGPRVARLYEDYGCRFISMDASGVGEAVGDILKAEGCAVLPFKYTAKSKEALVNRMVAEVERKRVTFLYNDQQLKNEMSMFEAEVKPGGTINYSAPPGYFDDCVNAAALAIWPAARNRGMASNPQQEPYATFQGDARRKRVVERARAGNLVGINDSVAALLERENG